MTTSEAPAPSHAAAVTSAFDAKMAQPRTAERTPGPSPRVTVAGWDHGNTPTASTVPVLNGSATATVTRKSTPPRRTTRGWAAVPGSPKPEAAKRTIDSSSVAAYGAVSASAGPRDPDEASVTDRLNTRPGARRGRRASAARLAAAGDSAEATTDTDTPTTTSDAPTDTPRSDRAARSEQVQATAGDNEPAAQAGTDVPADTNDAEGAADYGDLAPEFVEQLKRVTDVSALFRVHPGLGGHLGNAARKQAEVLAEPVAWEMARKHLDDAYEAIGGTNTTEAAFWTRAQRVGGQMMAGVPAAVQAEMAGKEWGQHGDPEGGFAEFSSALVKSYATHQAKELVAKLLPGEVEKELERRLPKERTKWEQEAKPRADRTENRSRMAGTPSIDEGAGQAPGSGLRLTPGSIANLSLAEWKRNSDAIKDQLFGPPSGVVNRRPGR